ncbi:hypothetical protein C8R46DRAFT_666562 [Mycena filopes]|nr:hypothetical protein C8R46DRAFT_666562 [Mycena filopes]
MAMVLSLYVSFHSILSVCTRCSSCFSFDRDLICLSSSSWAEGTRPTCRYGVWRAESVSVRGFTASGAVSQKKSSSPPKQRFLRFKINKKNVVNLRRWYCLSFREELNRLLDQGIPFSE